MKQLIDEKIKLLEAKNFDPSFTNLEKERIRYSIAERVAYYPAYRKAWGMNFICRERCFPILCRLFH